MNGTTSLARRASAALAGTVVAAALLAACGTTPASGPHPATSAAAGSSVDERTSSGAAAGAGFTTIDGATVRLPNSKPTVLVFFATACPSCGAAMVDAQHALGSTAGKATFLGVDLDAAEPADEITSFLHDIGVSGVPVVRDVEGKLAATYRVSALGTVIVISPSGKVAYRGVMPSPGAVLSAITSAS